MCEQHPPHAGGAYMAVGAATEQQHVRVSEQKLQGASSRDTSTGTMKDVRTGYACDASGTASSSEKQWGGGEVR